MSDLPVFDLPAIADVRWSARIVDVDSSERLFETNPDAVHKTASIGKLFLLIEVARQAEAGQLSLDERVDRRTEQPVADSGIWYTLDADTMTIDDACRLIGAVSDNLATNVMIGRIGLPAITETTAGIGVARSALLDRIREERLPQHPPTLSRGAGGELADLMAGLARGEVVSADVSARVLDWIGLNTDLSMVAAAFGLDPLAHLDVDRGMLLRNKTGTISTVRADVGVVTGARRRLAYAVLAEWTPESPAGARDEVLAAMRAVGEGIRALVE